MNIIGNWKTSTSGLTAILTALGTLVLTPLLDADPVTTPQWGTFIPIMIAGVASLFARDGDKTSDDLGLN